MSERSNPRRRTVSALAATLAAILLLIVAERSDAGLSDSIEAAEDNVNIISDTVTRVIIDPALKILDESLSPAADVRSIQGQAREYFSRTKRKLNEAASQAIHNNMKAAANMFGFGKVRGFRTKFRASVVDRVARFVESKAWDTAAAIADRLASGAQEAGRRAGSPLGGNSIVDMRIALAIDEDEQPLYASDVRVLGKERLPAVTVSRSSQAPDPYPGSLAEAWSMDAETIRRSRDPATYAAKPDPWGQDAGRGWDSPPAASAATKTDVWGADAGEREHTRRARASIARADPWGQDAGQQWDSPAGTPVAGDAGGELTDTEWQNEYAAALNHFLGLDDNDSSYEAALSTVETLEREAAQRVERERLAEQQRMETQERERQARLEAEKRERQIARMEAELESERAERRSRATAQAIVRGVQNAVGVLQPMLDRTANLIQQEKEARLRRDLARLREQAAAQARAKQEYAAIERQRQQTAEQQRRRQAEAQERQRREAEGRQAEEQQRQRQIAEEQRKEAERQAKAMRRQACLQRISGSRNGCVQPIRERGGSDWYHYYFRNNCNYPIAVWYGGQGDARLSSLAQVSPRSKAAYQRPKGRLRYAACYNDPGLSGPSCEIMSWACVE